MPRSRSWPKMGDDMDEKSWPTLSDILAADEEQRARFQEEAELMREEARERIGWTGGKDE